MSNKLIEIVVNNSKLLSPLSKESIEEKDFEKATNEVLNNKEVYATLKKLSVE